MKKLLLAVCLLLISATVIASEITCYKGDKLIYHGIGSQVWISPNYIQFVNSNNKRMHIPGQCQVISDNDQTWG